jgi:hypothetical protein
MGAIPGAGRLAVAAPTAQAAYAAKGQRQQRDSEHSRLDRDACDFAAVADIGPPADNEIEDGARGGLRARRQLRPGVGRVHIRNRLQQVQGKIFAPDLLDAIAELVDAQLRGVGGDLPGGKQAQVIAEFGAIAGHLLRLRRLAANRSRSQQLQLRLGGGQRGCHMARDGLDAGSHLLQRIAQRVEL